MEPAHGRHRMNGDVSLPAGLRNDPRRCAAGSRISSISRPNCSTTGRSRSGSRCSPRARPTRCRRPAPTRADPATSLFYIADDYVRLRERVVRLTKKEAHSEFPRSQQRHMISNVRITGLSGRRRRRDLQLRHLPRQARRGRHLLRQASLPHRLHGRSVPDQVQALGARHGHALSRQATIIV